MICCSVLTPRRFPLSILGKRTRPGYPLLLFPHPHSHPPPHPTPSCPISVLTGPPEEDALLLGAPLTQGPALPLFLLSPHGPVVVLTAPPPLDLRMRVEDFRGFTCHDLSVRQDGGMLSTGDLGIGLAFQFRSVAHWLCGLRPDGTEPL